MKLCRTCGAPMEDEEVFCQMCGAKCEDINTNAETIVLNNTSEETIILSPNDIPAHVNIPQQPEVIKPKKKLSKGAIIAIVIVAIVVIDVIGGALIIHRNNYIEAPRNPDSDINSNNRNYTYDEVNNNFIEAIVNNDADVIDTHVILYADEILSVLQSDYMYNLNYVDPTMDFVDGRELLDRIANSDYSDIEEDPEFSFDLQLNYYSIDSADETYYEVAYSDLAILDEVINEIFSVHGLDSISIENYIYKLYVFNDENGNYVDECEIGIIETSQGSYILGFE